MAATDPKGTVAAMGLGMGALDREVEQLLDEHRQTVPTEVRRAVINLTAEYRRLDLERSRWTAHLDEAIHAIEATRRLIAASDRPRVNDRVASIIRSTHAPTHPAVRRLDRDAAALRSVRKTRNIRES